MLTIGIVDDGVGFYPTLNKLKQVVSANFVCMLVNENFPLGNATSHQLLQAGSSAINKLTNMDCNAVVLSSIALSARCFKTMSAASSVPLFGCDAPVMHASTYTASKVLVVGDRYVIRAQSLPNVIACDMPYFPQLAENGDERELVKYIEQCCERYSGMFDCIALANSSMNMYKHCFSRVFPNVQIFDSLEGVARKIRKKYKKSAKEEGTCTIIDGLGNQISEKYDFFLQ